MDPRRMRRWAPAVALLALCLAGCAGPAPEPGASTPTLRDELLAMAERDQDGRTGGDDPEGDRARTARLDEIIDEIGWPTDDLVGDDGGDAAWLIAQHSDLDPAFQAEALELLRAAVEVGQASPGNLAYLEDRVRVGAGEPQVYGTQVGCAEDGPRPATPIEDPDGVEQRRADAGLGTLDEYVAEMAEICAIPDPQPSGG